MLKVGAVGAAPREVKMGNSAHAWLTKQKRWLSGAARLVVGALFVSGAALSACGGDDGGGGGCEGVVGVDGSCQKKCVESECVQPGMKCVGNACSQPCKGHDECPAGK